MCLGLPGKLVEISEDKTFGIVDIAGTKREVSLMILPEDVELGDYVMVHVGFAISKMDEAQAEETLKAIMEYYDGDDIEIQG
ncbi:HypC/HybG/HupF family hydrogenase formation chaperone [Deferribacteraceae bacterium V6Fe1]|nr:HypC/HybG/HupF family hydrogenase formation chaperone [Deferribacteraceae bacterium V6Fe1]